MNDTSLGNSSNGNGFDNGFDNGYDNGYDNVHQEDKPPSRCVLAKSSGLEISDEDIFFYYYVILPVVAAGLVVNVFFWAVLRTSSIPLGRLYNRFLVFISLMELLQLASMLLEAVWKLVSRLDYFGTSGLSTTGMSLMLMLLFCLRALSLYSVIFTFCWLGINAAHDMKFFYNGSTGSLLEKLKDFRGYKSLTFILVISLCIAIITEIPVIKVVGPYCVITINNNDELTYKLIHFLGNRPGFLTSCLRVVKPCIPLCFIAFIIIQCVRLVIILKESTALHHEALVTSRSNHTGNATTADTKDELLPCEPGPRPNENASESVIQSMEETNDIQLTFFYVIIPLTAQYFIFWSPNYIVINFNVLTDVLSQTTVKQITNHYVLWVFFTMKLVTSVLNPIFFIFANWKYYQNLILEDDRSRRVTQETNV